MAWYCSAKSNDGLVENLKRADIIKSERVVTAMKSIDRKNYVEFEPYRDSPHSIGYGATISAPHMHAYALQSLEPFLQPGMKALDIGSGSGYLSACMAQMVGPGGKIIGIDHIPELVNKAINNVKKDKQELLDTKRLNFIVGDGRKGYPEEAPYDCIHVGAAAKETPEALIDQLKSPGRMFIPVGSGHQSIYQIDKDNDGNIIKKVLMDVSYVPLTDAHKQIN
nr:3379_t:CDS:2 [Entrophospora candida]